MTPCVVPRPRVSAPAPSGSVVLSAGRPSGTRPPGSGPHATAIAATIIAAPTSTAGVIAARYQIPASKSPLTGSRRRSIEEREADTDRRPTR